MVLLVVVWGKEEEIGLVTWNTQDIHLRSTSMVFSRSVGEVRWEMGA